MTGAVNSRAFHEVGDTVRLTDYEVLGEVVEAHRSVRMYVVDADTEDGRGHREITVHATELDDECQHGMPIAEATCCFADDLISDATPAEDRQIDARRGT